MKKTAILTVEGLMLLGLLAGGGILVAQKKAKPWTEWSLKEAEKLLEDSAWAQTQVMSDMSEMFYLPGRGTGEVATQRDARGALNQTTALNLHIRFLSAKPVRQAFARVMQLQQENINDRLSQGLRDFVDRRFDDIIVVAVTYDSKDRRFSGPAMQAFGSATIGSLKNKTYLELKDGTRQFLVDYQVPINDGLGAKFIFNRIVDGRPFITPETGEVRFYCELSKEITLNMRYKVRDFLYGGVLEF